MLEIYVKTILAIAVLLAFIVPGFILRKLKVIEKNGKRTLSSILLYVCQPALMISSFCVFSEEDFAEIKSIGYLPILKNFFIAAVLSLAAMLLVFVLARLLFLKYPDKGRADIYAYASIFSNCGFLGVPFIEILTDGSVLAVMYLMIFNVVFNILVWTLGVWLITGNRSDISIKKILINPLIISTLFALLLFFVPQINFFMFEPLKDLQLFPSYLSTMTAPLSMIIVGISMADIPFKTLFDDIGIYATGLLRLVIAPIATLGLAIALQFITANFLTPTPQSDYIFLAPVIAMAMSPAATIVAMSEQYGKDTSRATATFVTNTLLSVITLPLVMSLALLVWDAIF